MREVLLKGCLNQPVIWGPIFLIAALAIYAKAPLDLLFLAVSGLYLTANWKMRGCVYALVLLFLSSVVKHFFLVDHHLFQLVLEISLGAAFFMTGLAFEQGASFIENLNSQVETRKAAVTNLEEEMSKIQEHTQELQIFFQEKVAKLQKELEELQADHSSILILNEVLRKKGAKELLENESIKKESLDVQRQNELLHQDLQRAEEELAWLKKTDEVILQNRELMEELNTARSQELQTHLINETLARLYAKESFKAKEYDMEAASLKEQLRRQAEPLQEKITDAKKENESLKAQFEKALMEADRAREELNQVRQIQQERNFLKERLTYALEELSLVKEQRIDPEIQANLQRAEEKVGELSKIEPLYKQLKVQFEEKNKVLHEVRSQLFKAHTDLERMKIEKEALEIAPLPKELEKELEELMLQVEVLEEENGILMGQIEKKKPS